MRDIHVCNIGNIQPKQLINVNGSDYRFFPWGQKITNGGTDVISSQNFGVAYKVV